MSRIAVRVNTLKTSVENLKNKFHESGIVSEHVIWYPSALLVQSTTQDLTSLPEYENGLFYIQQLSSMIPALELDVHTGNHVLDICSAPGSKTSQIAELCHDQCSIIANDVSAQRIHRVVSTARRHDISSINTFVRSGESFGRTHPNFFDKVLVDVPCSMGQLYAPKNLKHLIYRQRALLRSGFRALSSNGTLVYSTCSPRIEENDDVITWLLKKEPTAEIIQYSTQSLPTSWYDGNYIRIPQGETESDFFVAKITKHENSHVAS